MFCALKERNTVELLRTDELRTRRKVEEKTIFKLFNFEMYFSAIHFPQRFLLLISNQEASENNFLLGALGMYLVQRFKLAVLCNIALTAS